MLVPVKWLKKYIDINISTKELGERMTMTGSKVETIVELGNEISNVVVGKILSVQSHPNADKLVICLVDVGNETVQIVTGAPNIQEGQLVPVALHGATLPGNIKIKRNRLRGIESQGMLCSGEELGLREEDYPGAGMNGIMILQEDYPLGMDIKEALDLDDEVIEFEITSNRPDCLSIIGIVREAAVALKTQYKFPSIKVEPGEGDINQELAIHVEDGELCPRYCARVVKDIKIEPSPLWMRRRLAAAGIRPINNIVDITNYVMLELGQPMHAFDLDQVAQGKIIVRRAGEGEKIVTLDGKERLLDNEMLVIADAEKAIGIAGVMGGANSEITERTKAIVLESAKFSGTSIRMTSKKLGLRSEASNRFEKGLDVHNVTVALDRAAQLIQELGAGTVINGVIDICHDNLEVKKLNVKWDKINQLLGLELSPAEIKNILTDLGFQAEYNSDIMTVTIPTFRQDIEGVADLAEEVARIYGYNNIPMSLMKGSVAKGRKTQKQRLVDQIKQLLTGMGLYETVTYSFIGPHSYEAIGLKYPQDVPPVVKISNPLGEEQSIMRTTLIPSILEVLSRNSNRSQDLCQVFEVNAVFLPKKLPLDELPIERSTLTIGEYGDGIDFYDIKGKIEKLLDTLGLLGVTKFYPINHPTFHPGRTASVKIAGQDIGILGEIHPTVLSNYDIEYRVQMAELDFDAILGMVNINKEYKPLPKYPAIKRDLALVVKKNILASQIEQLIKQVGGRLLDKVELFDVYEGEQIPDGYKSMAYALSYQALDRTLKDEEINNLHDKIIYHLEKDLGARLR